MFTAAFSHPKLEVNITPPSSEERWNCDVFIFDGILLSNTKEQTIDTCNNMNEP